jgi:trimeric autotransporter adhesin
VAPVTRSLWSRLSTLLFANFAAIPVALVLAGCTASSSTLNLGTIATVAGTGKLGNSGDGGSATAAELYQPTCVVTDSAGNLYIGDLVSNTIRKVAASTGIISTYASVTTPAACAVDSAGNLYVADASDGVIQKITASTGIITTVAGDGTSLGPGFSSPAGSIGDGGPATKAELNVPWGVAVDAAGNLFISDTFDQRVREVDASTGIISTIAGNGTPGYSLSGGVATDSMLYNPAGLSLDGTGNLYIAEQANGVIAKLDLASGTLTTVAGNGTSNGTALLVGDGGPATLAELGGPMSVAVDAKGDIFIPDWSANRIREVFPTGIIRSVVGTTQGYSGDGGPSDKAKISCPWGLSFDSSGNLYIADSANGAVRKVTP